MERKLNILTVVPAMNAGGVEMGVLELAKLIGTSKDFNLFILTSGGKLLSQINYDNVKVIILNVKSKNPFVILKNQSKIRKILIDNKIDIVQLESRVPAWNCVNICRKLNIPTVSIIHGNYSIGNGIVKIFKLFYNSIMMKCNKVVAVSNYTKQYCLNNYNLKDSDVDVIYRGIDTENIFNPDIITEESVENLKKNLDLEDSKKIIIYPARLSKQKGQDYLIKSLSMLKNRDFLCLLVGNDDKHKEYRQSLIDLIKEYNLQNNVKFVKNINNIEVLYKICDVVVSSAILPETFGRVSIEAQAMKKIFVGTNLGGTLETIIDKKTGFLAPYNDNEKFAETIENALHLDDDERLKIVEEARKHIVNNFTISIFYEKMKKLYFNLTSK